MLPLGFALTLLAALSLALRCVLILVRPEAARPLFDEAAPALAHPNQEAAGRGTPG